MPGVMQAMYSKSLEEPNMREKSEKIRVKLKKLDEDAMLCNSLWSDRCRLIAKTFLAFSCTLESIQTFHKKVFLLYSERNFAFQ